MSNSLNWKMSVGRSCSTLKYPSVWIFKAAGHSKFKVVQCENYFICRSFIIFWFCEMTDEEMKGSIRNKLASTRKGNISATSRKWLKIAYMRGPWFPLVAFLDPLLLTRTCKFRCCFTTKVTPLAPSSCIWYLSWPSDSQKTISNSAYFT